MKQTKTIKYSTGTSLPVLLFLLFLTLKLCGLIDWSWWWVTCPPWIGFALVASIIAGCAFFVLAIPCIVAGFAWLFCLVSKK